MDGDLYESVERGFDVFFAMGCCQSQSKTSYTRIEVKDGVTHVIPREKEDFVHSIVVNHIQKLITHANEIFLGNFSAGDCVFSVWLVFGNVDSKKQWYIRVLAPPIDREWSTSLIYHGDALKKEVSNHFIGIQNKEDNKCRRFFFEFKHPKEWPEATLLELTLTVWVNKV